MRDVHNSIKRFFPGLVTEIRKGVAGSKYGFEAFFLSNDNINPVVETFSRILDQEKVMIRGRPERILFVCVNADDQQPQIATFYQQWRTQVEQRQASGRSLEDAEKESTVALSITPDSNAILLYPTFFALPALPNRKRDCPVVKRTFSGGFSLPGVTQLQDSMYGTAIHELVHKYLHLSVQDVDEARTVADSMNLPAEKQVQNAANYAFLACGKHSSPILPS